MIVWKRKGDFSKGTGARRFAEPGRTCSAWSNACVHITYISIMTINRYTLHKISCCKLPYIERSFAVCVDANADTRQQLREGGWPPSISLVEFAVARVGAMVFFGPRVVTRIEKVYDNNIKQTLEWLNLEPKFSSARATLVVDRIT